MTGTRARGTVGEVGTSGTASPEEVLALVRTSPAVHVTLAAARKDDGSWQVVSADLVSGEPPEGWTARTWTYLDVLLTSFLDTGAGVAGWLADGVLDVDGASATVPAVDPTLWWQRRASHVDYGLQPLGWPTVEVDLTRGEQRQGQAFGECVAVDDSPSFASYELATASFFRTTRKVPAPPLPTTVRLRHQDRRARVAGVVVRDDIVGVTVGGTALVTVELAGDEPGPAETVQLSGAETTVGFELPGGLPAGAWVLVRADGTWLDTRFLSTPYGPRGTEGVEWLVEPGTRLQTYIAGREGERVEFKRQVPQDEKSRQKVAKTVCAFSNGTGGSLLFGIDDDHRVEGADLAGVNREMDRLTGIVAEWVEPVPHVTYEVLPTDDDSRVVLEMVVAPGMVLCGCRPRLGAVHIVYVRHGATTVPARPRETEQMVVRHEGATGGDRVPGRW